MEIEIVDATPNDICGELSVCKWLAGRSCSREHRLTRTTEPPAMMPEYSKRAWTAPIFAVYVLCAKQISLGTYKNRILKHESRMRDEEVGLVGIHKNTKYLSTMPFYQATTKSSMGAMPSLVVPVTAFF